MQKQATGYRYKTPIWMDLDIPHSPIDAAEATQGAPSPPAQYNYDFNYITNCSIIIYILGIAGLDKTEMTYCYQHL